VGEVAAADGHTTIAQKSAEIRSQIIKKTRSLAQIRVAVKTLCRAFPIPEQYI
jgi:hypothetical protein